MGVVDTGGGGGAGDVDRDGHILIVIVVDVAAERGSARGQSPSASEQHALLCFPISSLFPYAL